MNIFKVTITLFYLKVLDATDRGELVDAAFALANAEYIPIETALNMTKYLKKETHLLGIYVTLKLRIFRIGLRLKGTPNGFPNFLVCSFFVFIFLDNSVDSLVYSFCIQQNF